MEMNYPENQARKSCERHVSGMTRTHLDVTKIMSIFAYRKVENQELYCLTHSTLESIYIRSSANENKAEITEFRFYFVGGV